jgi:hypothetical protein
MIPRRPKLLLSYQTAKSRRNNLTRRLCCLALAGALFLSRSSFAGGTNFAGLVLHGSLAAPVKVAAGAQDHGLAFDKGNLPIDGTSYSAINRAIVFVTAGAAATTCIVGLSDGAMKSAAISVPANVTLAIIVEDTGGDAPPDWPETTGFVVYAGAAGGLTVLPGSSAIKTVFATQARNNLY